MKAQRGTSTFFDSYAGAFSAIYGTSNTLPNRVINRFLRKSMRIRFEKTIEGCDPIEGKSVIDIGCGPGHYGVALAQRGAAHVFGIDFAPGMIDLANENARAAGVESVCEFAVEDFLNLSEEERFDYAILMGFMDYVEDPREILRKALAMIRNKVFASFPLEGGFLAWQRKIRYRNRCDLYLYRLNEIEGLVTGMGHSRVIVEKISRDAFLTVNK
jgi:2-polyprenyl-3-methyl-5-hydroxy-6-metoxy-1,4-benzoquinol methylase